MDTGVVCLRREKLQRDESVQVLVDRFVANPDSAFTEFGLNLVMENPLGLGKTQPVGLGISVKNRVGETRTHELGRVQLHDLQSPSQRARCSHGKPSQEIVPSEPSRMESRLLQPPW